MLAGGAVSKYCRSAHVSISNDSISNDSISIISNNFYYSRIST